jgi:hypothetical protein
MIRFMDKIFSKETLTAWNAVRETVWTILLCADVANGAGIKGEHLVLELMPYQGG